MSKKYSIYDRRTDQPVIIYGTAEQCASALGMKVHSFYSLVMRQRKGERVGKCEIFEDEEDDDLEMGID